MAIRNLLLMSVALVTLAACSSDEDAAPVDTSMSGLQGGQLGAADGANGPGKGHHAGLEQALSDAALYRSDVRDQPRRPGHCPDRAGSGDQTDRHPLHPHA